METNLLDCPDEILVHILSQNPYCWKGARQTCLKLYHLVNDVFSRQKRVFPSLTCEITLPHAMPGLGSSLCCGSVRKRVLAHPNGGVASVDALVFDPEGRLYMAGRLEEGDVGFVYGVDNNLNCYLFLLVGRF